MYLTQIEVKAYHDLLVYGKILNEEGLDKNRLKRKLENQLELLDLSNKRLCYKG